MCGSHWSIINSCTSPLTVLGPALLHSSVIQYSHVLNALNRKSSHHKWPASLKIWGVEEFETLPAGAKQRTLCHRSPGGERRENSEALDDLPSKDEKGQLTISQATVWTGSKFPRDRTECIIYGLFLAPKVNTILNCLNWFKISERQDGVHNLWAFPSA